MSEAKTTPMVDVAREMEARPETVWSILTTPEGFSVWMDGQATFDAQVGSPVRVAFPAYDTVMGGEVVTLEEEAGVFALTWGVESGPQADTFPAGSTLLELTVEGTPEGCRVRIVHSRLPSDQVALEHEQGWRFHLGRLELRANRTDLSPALERSLDAWFSAWNERDEDSRMEALTAACTPGVEFRDDWAVAEGVERLSLHIANCFRYMPGWKLEPTGDVRICRGEVLFGWRSQGPGGTIEGFNHGRAGLDGKLVRVTGFQAT